MTTHNSRKPRSKRVRSTRLLQSFSYQGGFGDPTSIEMVSYNKNNVEIKKMKPGQSLSKEIGDKSFYWFRIVGFSDVSTIESICKDFGIQRYDIKDLLSNMNITKIVTYDKSTFIMMSGCIIDDSSNIEMEQIAFIMGQNYIISFQEAPSPLFDDIVAAIKDSNLQLRSKGVDYLLYFLLNSVHNVYIDAIGRIYDKVEEIEDRLIEKNETDRWIMSFFRSKRRDYQLLWRAITPFREEYANLLQDPNELLDKKSMIYFDDFDDRMRTTLEELEMLNSSIHSLMDLYFNNNNLKMNEIIKRLTVVSTIFIPLTFMVGVWGMNFRIMPELDWQYGYLVAWGILGIIALIAIYFLKKKRWF